MLPMNMNMNMMMMRRLNLNGRFKAKTNFCYCTKTLTGDGRKSLKVLGESQALANALLTSRDAYYDFETRRVAVSPSSLHVILSLLAAGSTGWSRRHFLRFFQVESLDEINASVSLLNNSILASYDHLNSFLHSSTSLWHHHTLPLHSHFLNCLHNHHAASLHPLDFHNQAPLARQEINSKVERDTSGLIKDLIPEMEPFTNSSSSLKLELVFTNTLHFKGHCDMNAENHRSYHISDRFKEEYDYFFPEKFLGAEIISTIDKHIHGWEEDDHYPCLNLRNKLGTRNDEQYVNLNCCYSIPEQDYSKALRANSYYIPNETWMHVAGKEIPKFNVFSDLNATNVVREHGILLPFYAGGLRELLCPPYSDLNKELCLWDIWQKTFINVNEEGSEAATATTGIVVSGCPPLLPPSGKCDKPYGCGLLDEGCVYARKGLQVLQHLGF